MCEKWVTWRGPQGVCWLAKEERGVEAHSVMVVMVMTMGFQVRTQKICKQTKKGRDWEVLELVDR